MSHTPSRRPPAPFEATLDSDYLRNADAPPGAYLFEIAWEVCNQVGGIYQVLRSKAQLMVDRWRDQYCLVGPYVPNKAQLELESTLPTGYLGQLAEALTARGIVTHHGRWLIPGKPRVLLLEHRLPGQRLAGVKYRLWEHHSIESPAHDPLIDGALGFGEAVRELLALASAPGPISPEYAVQSPRRVVAHFHEWQGGVALPMVRRDNLPVATLFTTHATQLGRYLASSHGDFYDRLDSYNHDEVAKHFNVKTQHDLERACAHGAHVFTTVSQITAEECTSLLGRAPDVVTPNGLSIAPYSVGHDFQTYHADFKERLHAFTMGHFFPSYAFDLDRTIYMFTSGRFEPRNKGFDLCLEAMARLNLELRAHNLDLNVVFFIITSRPTRSIHPLVLEKRGVLNELREVCQNVVDRVGEQLFRRSASGSRVPLDSLVDEYWQLRLRRTQAAFRTSQLPPVVTHFLDDYATDPVLEHIRSLGLFNRAEDAVKVVYHPEFISPVNPLWGIEYDQFVRGCHLGVFPSTYEPWGYTPLECMALGTPAITSDLAGFGRYVQETYGQFSGLRLVERRGRSFDDAARQLTEQLVDYCRMTRRQRVALRNDAERRSWDFDWQKLGKAYHRAHDLALSRL
jgi:glycogen synthase